MDTILWPIKVVVAWVMVRLHDLFVLLGMKDGPGYAWVLSIVGLTIVVRIVIMPLFFKQIRASRGMQLMQPELKALQEKYKGKKDPASQQKMQEEMMALYRKHGTNPFSSCLPILVQMPIFFALFRVLANLQKVATGTYSGHDSIGPLTAQLAADAQNSNLFGAGLNMSFMSSGDNTEVKIVTLVMIVLMSVTQFYTMHQLTMKNMPASATSSDNPAMRSQKMMMYVMPLIFAFSGVQFQIGVLIYWLTTNVWTMGQQFWAIHRMPAPGSEADMKRRARENEKRARQGRPSLEEEERAAAIARGEIEEYKGGQRKQPSRKKRQRGTGVASAEASESDSAEPKTTPANPAGLTAEEIARRRYEKRAKERRQAAQRRKKNNK